MCFLIACEKNHHKMPPNVRVICLKSSFAKDLVHLEIYVCEGVLEGIAGKLTL